MRRVLQLEDQQVMLLQAVNQKVDALLSTPYSSGQEHVKCAIRLGSSAPDQVNAELEQARKCFFDALGAWKDDALKKSLTAEHLALIEIFIGRRSEAQHWAEIAHTEAANATKQACENVNQQIAEKRPLSPTRRGWLLWALLGILMGVAVASVVPVGGILGLVVLLFVGWRVESTGTDFITGRYQKKATGKLRQLHARVVALASWRHDLGIDPGVVPTYELVTLGGGHIKELAYREQ
jgi:hypothetical protein